MKLPRTDQRPRVLLLIDQFNWAFHTLAKGFEKHLCDRFAITIVSAKEHPKITEEHFDLMFVFGGEQLYHKQFISGKCTILKGVYSNYWELELGLSPKQFYDSYAREAHALVVPNQLLLEKLHALPIPVHLCHEGVNTKQFRPGPPRSGPLVAGWAGAADRKVKRANFASQACADLCTLRTANGALSLTQMESFYHSIDVIICCSEFEGSPKPIIEAMACGRFPVSFPKTVAPELIVHGNNGFIVHDESIEGLRNALQWCSENLETIRSRQKMNVEQVRAGWTEALSAERMATIWYSLL